MKLGISFFLCGLLLLTGIASLSAQSWQMKQAVLMTPYASQVDPQNVLPEYPRPQLQRSDWLNLNGIWQFQPGLSTDSLPNGTLTSQILVPFPVESAISGIMQHYDRLWYKRSFTVPAAWSGKRIMLNFGAIDWESQVYVNGQSVGIHKGGYDPFSYDITAYLVGNGAQELTVRVYDPTDNGGNPRGKQTLYQGGIMYTPTTGIWQSVWLEPINTVGIKDIKIVPDVDNSCVKLTVNTLNSASGVSLQLKVLDTGSLVQTVTASPNAEVSIPLSNAKLWSPDSPFLYDLQISVIQNGTVVDSATSYFGMRKISVGLVDGFNKMLLNNKFVFQMGPLDQGFWPDGVYTAPTDEALKSDLIAEKAFGYNMVRKHIKVEPARWYYWADKLGIMVWQDMPSANSYSSNPPPMDTAQYSTELIQMVKTHWNSPSIIMWVIFNEGQGQYSGSNVLDAMVKNLDPSRLVNSGSGSFDNAGDVIDIHSYPPPGAPSPQGSYALACGEYGGIGYKFLANDWDPDSWGYTMVSSAAELAAQYDDYASALTNFKTNNGLSAAVYTEITDVQQEINGLLTYDRVINKANGYGAIAGSNTKVVKMLQSIAAVVPTSEQSAVTWKYTTSSPASNWNSTGYNDGGWASSPGAFGTAGTPGISPRTTWSSADIWLRQQFNPGNLNTADLAAMVFRTYHDEDVEIYINGVLAASATGYVGNYISMPINQAGKNALIANANNVLAVHCHQTIGGQGVDVGIVKLSYVSDSALVENFSTNLSKWQNFGGDWTLSNGVYAVAANPGAKSVAIGKTFADLVYDADVSVASGGNAGVIFRDSNITTGTDSYSGYYAGISASNGTVELGKANNNWTRLAIASRTISANVMHHLRVLAKGNSIQVFVDDLNTPVISVTDSSYASGSIGLRTYQVNAQFDNVVAVPVFSDNFSTGAAAWTTFGGIWQVSSGQYTVAGNAGAKAVAKDLYVADCTVEADLSVGLTGNAGLILRASNPTVGTDAYSGYYFGISAGDSLVQIGKANNNWTQLASSAMSLSASTSYHVKIVAKGSTLQFFVSDMSNPKLTVTDSSYSTGGVGLRTYLTDASFDNIMVY